MKMLNEESNYFLSEMINASYQDKAGIVRTAIDYLYFQMLDIPLPAELEEIIYDLKKGLKFQELKRVIDDEVDK